MSNPFFKNHGPFNILEILKILKIDHDNIFNKKEDIYDVKDLFSSSSEDVTFFILKNIKRLLIIQKHLIALQQTA